MRLNGLTVLATVVLTLGLGHFAGNTHNIYATDGERGRVPRAEDGTSALEEFAAAVSDSPYGLALDVLAVSLTDPAAATTELNVRVESGGSDSIRVAPGAEVRYEVVGVLSDDVNEGLALVGFDLVFDGGDLAQADSPSGVPTPGCDNPMINFTIPWGITNPAGYGGTVIDGDLIQVGGAQNTLNNTPDNAPYPIGPVLTGVAQPGGCGPAVLVTGILAAPDLEGTYTLALTELFVNVIREGETGEPYWATEPAGVGTITPLTIVVAAEAPVLHGSPKIYWTGFSGGTIHRADLSGANVEELVTRRLYRPFGVAVDRGSAKIYWTDTEAQKIQRADMDVSSVEDLVVTGLHYPAGITLDIDEGKMYWADADAHKIQCASLDGSNVEVVVATSLSYPRGIALDLLAGKMYWTDKNNGKIQRANLDGSDVEDFIINGLLKPRAIAVDPVERKLYWSQSRYIRRVDLDDASNIETLVSDLGQPMGLALDLRMPVIAAALDIKPGACPNPVNMRSRGVVPMVVVSTESFDVTEVDVDSLVLTRADGLGGFVTPLMGPPGPGIRIGDVATPFDGDPCNCHDLHGDGIEDLFMRFSTREMVEALELRESPRRTELMLTVSGSLLDGTEFEASDCIFLVGRKKDVSPPRGLRRTRRHR